MSSNLLEDSKQKISVIFEPNELALINECSSSYLLEKY